VKLPKYSQYKFGIVLGTGALIAIVLCIQCVRTFLYIDSVLVPREAEQEAQRDAGALGAAAHNAGIDDPRKLSPVLRHALESAADRVLWIRVLDADNNVLSEAGNDPVTSRIPLHWWDRVQRHESLGTVVKTSQGKALSILLPLRMPQRSRTPHDRRPGYILALGISLNAVASAFVDLRKHLIIGMIASISLLVAIAVIAMRARQYVRGRYLETELQLARRVQNDLHPKEQPISPHIEFGASAVPADHVGGDFYDIFELESGKIGIVLGDVSGKGVPAALLVSVLQGAIRSSTASRHELACERINRMLCERTANERFATLFWAVFDPAAGTLRYVNAGHGAPILVQADRNRIERLTDGGPILGCLLNARYSAGEIQISNQDTLAIYTDGVSEAANKNGEEFGDERVIQILSEDRGFTPGILCQRIENEVTAFVGPQAQPDDDRTLLVVRFVSRQTAVGESKLGSAMAQVA
jgi:serine phosphatase RsbU (regulator of sigma subunit)